MAISMTSVQAAALAPAPLTTFRPYSRVASRPRMAFADAEDETFELGDWRRERPKPLSSMCDFRGRQVAQELPGITAPFGFFDPLSMTPEDSGAVLLYRESEILHGRVAMLAAVGFLVQDGIGFHPLLPADMGPAINQLNPVPAGYIYAALAVIGCIEINRAQTAMVVPNFKTEGTAVTTVRTLRNSYTPGDLAFDPMSLYPKSPKEQMVMQTKELNNGRLAMIGVAGMVAQELVSGSTLFRS